MGPRVAHVSSHPFHPATLNEPTPPIAPEDLSITGAAYELWDNAHTAALEDYRVNELISALYHPDVAP